MVHFWKNTLVPFKVRPLRLDAAIPALLLLLETLSKIFNGNAFKGRQRFSLNTCNVDKTPPFQILIHPWEQKKKSQGARSGESRRREGGETTAILLSAKREACADVAGVQRESLAALDSISVEDFRQRLQK